MFGVIESRLINESIQEKTSDRLEMKYTIEPTIYARSSSVCIAADGDIHLVEDSSSASGKSQVLLNVYVTVNDQEPEFEFTENLMRSFTLGKFYGSWTDCVYQQLADGFCVVFVDLEDHETKSNPLDRVKSIDIRFNLICTIDFTTEKFSEILLLCDYAFAVAYESFATVAPVIFTPRRRSILKLKSLFAPIQRALDVTEKDRKIQSIVERFVSSEDEEDEDMIDPFLKCNKTWLNEGSYFKPMEYKTRKLIVLDKGDDDTVHFTCLPSSTIGEIEKGDYSSDDATL